LSARFEINPNCAFRRIDGELVILVPEKQSLHRLKEVGLRIWELVGEGKTSEEIVERLVTEYQVQRKDAEKDVKEFLDLLLENRIITIQGQ
jgi:hypothetical protein